MSANVTPPVEVDPVQWRAAIKEFAPMVGGIVLVWSALEVLIYEMTVEHRIRNANPGEAPDIKLSHKFRERVNEWIRRLLPEVGRVDEGNAFRDEVMRLQEIRNNVAHNVHTMWLDENGQPLMFCTFDTSDGRMKMRDNYIAALPEGVPHPPVAEVIYDMPALEQAWLDIQKQLAFVSAVLNVFGEKPLVRSDGTIRSRLSLIDLPTNPRESGR